MTRENRLVIVFTFLGRKKKQDLLVGDTQCMVDAHDSRRLTTTTFINTVLTKVTLHCQFCQWGVVSISSESRQQGLPQQQFIMKTKSIQSIGTSVKKLMTDEMHNLIPNVYIEIPHRTEPYPTSEYRHTRLPNAMTVQETVTTSRTRLPYVTWSGGQRQSTESRVQDLGK